MNKCTRCKKMKGTVKYTSSTNHRTNTVTHYYLCRRCNTERCRKYRLSDEGRKKVNAAVYKSIKKLQYKQDARMILNQKIRSGKIIRPKICPVCKKRRKVEGHHTDYSKPLKVKWSCRPCYFNVK